MDFVSIHACMDDGSSQVVFASIEFLSIFSDFV
jgi:hypothetical protein